MCNLAHYAKHVTGPRILGGDISVALFFGERCAHHFQHLRQRLLNAATISGSKCLPDSSNERNRVLR